MSGEQFLEKTMTVVGKHSAISDKNEEFLRKYATIVGSDSAIKEVCGVTGVTGVSGSEFESGDTAAAEPEVGETGVGE